MARWVSERCLDACAASMPGRMVALCDGQAWYPALLQMQSRARVFGTLAVLDLVPGDLARLDHYEGKAYKRASVQVRLQGGALCAALAYVWNGAVPATAERVAGGDFLHWMQQSGRRIYRARSWGM